jgi:prolipoprotein diacylglyceryltransferase
VARHPVQFYELFGILALLSTLWALLRRLQPGFAALCALAGYAGVRLLVDAFRAEVVTIGPGLRLSQLVAWIVLLLALLTLYQLAFGDNRPGH